MDTTLSPTVDTTEHSHGPAKGLGRRFFTTNNKDKGTLYLWFS
jgi:cytochrome c oxidase subunit 1